jgi:hypothetical protein
MPRKSAAQRVEQMPASIPEVLVSPSKAEPHQRDAYWLELIDNPEEFRKAIATEDFFPLLKELPEALWGSRLSIYLYRLPDEDGMQVKNPEGTRKYIKPVIRTPIDEDWIASRHGGGKYLLYLKLDNKESLRQSTVVIDGPPKLAPGQTVEIDGKNVPVGSVAQPSTQTEERSDIAKVIDANSRANESSMGLVTHAAEAAIDLVKAQAATSNTQQKDPMDLALRIVEVMRTAQPAQPAQDATLTALTLLEKIEAIIAKRMPPEREEKESNLNESIELVQTLTGQPISQLMKTGARVAAADPTPSWVPLALTAVERLFQVAPQLMHQAAENRRLEFERAVYLRNNPQGAVPQHLLASPPAPATVPPGPTIVPNVGAQPAAQVDPGQVINAIVNMIAQGFDKDPRGGYECASAIAFHFAPVIESMGIQKTFADPEEVDKFVVGIPALAQRSQDARWPGFRNDFLEYTIDRWGEEDGEEDETPDKSAPQPVRARRPSVADATPGPAA